MAGKLLKKVDTSSNGGSSSKTLSKSKKTDTFLFDKVKIVDINSLKPHPKNPNEGDLDSIGESLGEHGMYKPVVVNRRNGLIAAGHHTWLSARREGWTKIAVIEIDVDEARHRKIMLIDNRSSDLRRYNDVILAEVLRDLDDVIGTGYTPADVDEIAQRAREMAGGALKSIEKSVVEEEKRKRFERAPLGEEAGDDDTDYSGMDDDDVDSITLEKAPDDLKGAFSLKDDMAFDGVGKWGIPRIRTDMLMTYEELPDNILAWAGSATKDWPDENQWWLYNYGIDSTSGMKDVSKVIVAFYCYDEYFEPWWWNPAKYVTKLLNSGIKYIVMPDFSMHTPGEESRVISMWSLYKSRWLARYFQEAGLKLIPEVTWATADEDFLTRYVLATLPKNIPLLALQVQTIEEDHPLFKDWVRQVQLVLDTLNPQSLLVYHGKQGRRVFDKRMVRFSGKIKFVESRLYKLAEQASKREKKKTI